MHVVHFVRAVHLMPAVHHMAVALAEAGAHEHGAR